MNQAQIVRRAMLLAKATAPIVVPAAAEVPALLRKSQGTKFNEAVAYARKHGGSVAQAVKILAKGEGK